MHAPFCPPSLRPFPSLFSVLQLLNFSNIDFKCVSTCVFISVLILGDIREILNYTTKAEYKKMEN